MDQHTIEVLDDPHGIHGVGAARLVEVIRVNSPVETAGTQAKAAPTLSPVSSPRTTSASRKRSRTQAKNSSSMAAPSLTIEMIVAVEIGAP
jgi:hypothetical protein